MQKTADGRRGQRWVASMAGVYGTPHSGGLRQGYRCGLRQTVERGGLTERTRVERVRRERHTRQAGGLHYGRRQKGRRRIMRNGRR